MAIISAYVRQDSIYIKDNDYMQVYKIEITRMKKFPPFSLGLLL